MQSFWTCGPWKARRCPPAVSRSRPSTSNPPVEKCHATSCAMWIQPICTVLLPLHLNLPVMGYLHTMVPSDMHLSPWTVACQLARQQISCFKLEQILHGFQWGVDVFLAFKRLFEQVSPQNLLQCVFGWLGVAATCDVFSLCVSSPIVVLLKSPPHTGICALLYFLCSEDSLLSAGLLEKIRSYESQQTCVCTAEVQPQRAYLLDQVCLLMICNALILLTWKNGTLFLLGLSSLHHDSSWFGS